jgi:hypothetical protein
VTDLPLSTQSADSNPCAAARRVLDLARDEDRAGGPVVEAREHARTCPACRVMVERQERWDERLGAAMRDVSVPVDLRDRLLDSLARASAEDLVTRQSIAPVEVRRTRRGWLRISLATTAGLLAIAASVWFAMRWAQPRIPLEDLLQQIVSDEIEAETLAEFEGEPPPLPGTMSTRSIAGAPRRFPFGDAAVYFFQLPRRRGGPVAGRLLVIPARSLSNLPAGTSFLADPAIYPGGGYCATVWVEGEFAYVCIVKGGENELQRLHAPRPLAI